jgi:hypothetical protein
VSARGSDTPPKGGEPQWARQPQRPSVAHTATRLPPRHMHSFAGAFSPPPPPCARCWLPPFLRDSTQLKTQRKRAVRTQAKQKQSQHTQLTGAQAAEEQQQEDKTGGDEEQAREGRRRSSPWNRLLQRRKVEKKLNGESCFGMNCWGDLEEYKARE